MSLRSNGFNKNEMPLKIEMGVEYRFRSPRSRIEQEVQAQEVKRLLEEDHKDIHPTWCHNHTKRENILTFFFDIL